MPGSGDKQMTAMPHPTMRLRACTAMPEAMRRLYLESFPAEERRPLHILEKLISEPAAPVTLLLLERDQDCSAPAGFITLWRLSDGTAYIEHFATRPELRGAGLGATALSLIDTLIGPRPLVIEVERPSEGIMAQRRIAFYERCGFRLHDGYSYIQPPYSHGLPSVEMRLMTRGDTGSRDIADIAAMLRKEVYNTVMP